MTSGEKNKSSVRPEKEEELSQKQLVSVACSGGAGDGGVWAVLVLPQVAEPSTEMKKTAVFATLLELDSSPERRTMILIPADVSAALSVLLSEANLWRRAA